MYAQIEIVVKFFPRCFENVRVQKLRFPGRDPGSGRYREVREAHRNRFHLFSSRLTRGARSYDQKTKKVNDYLINDYFNVSVENNSARHCLTEQSREQVL